MFRFIRSSLFASLLAVAAPAAAESTVGEAGTWLVGGSSYFSVHSEQGEWEERARTAYRIQLAPDVTVFARDRLAIRVAPGIAWESNETSKGTERWESLFLEFGPAAYFPIGGDRVFLLTGVSLSFERGTFSDGMANRVVYTGPGVMGEVGLALPTRAGGLAEFVGSLSRRFLVRAEVGDGVDYDITHFSFGLRYSLIL